MLTLPTIVSIYILAIETIDHYSIVSTKGTLTHADNQRGHLAKDQLAMELLALSAKFKNDSQAMYNVVIKAVTKGR